MSRFPGGKRFAFSVFDDTDGATADNITPVYYLLAQLGMRTTKSVWPLESVPEGRIGGASLADPAYLEFIRGLSRGGFEIALHNVRNHGSERSLIADGLRRFEQSLGHMPRIHCNHSTNRDNIYWGAARLSGLLPRLAYLAAHLRSRRRFDGHVQGSPYFWGDLCREHITYVRNLTFNTINLDTVNPTMPYHDPRRPYVNYWFSSSDGADCARFCDLLTEANQDALAQAGGVCIVYTHFASGFTEAADVAEALNSIGAAPRDIIAIFEAMKQAGALRAELVII